MIERPAMDAQLSARLAKVEDHLAILNLIAAHPPVVDTQSNDRYRQMFTAAGVLDRGDLGEIPVADFPAHSPEMQAAMRQGIAHLGTPPYVVIDGDSAIAISYVAVTVLEPALPSLAVPLHGEQPGHRLFRMTANRWDLRRDGGEWRIARREIRLVDGGEAHRDLFRTVLRADP